MEMDHMCHRNNREVVEEIREGSRAESQEVENLVVTLEGNPAARRKAADQKWARTRRAHS